MSSKIAVRAAGEIPHQFQGQKVKGQGLQAALRRDRKSAVSSVYEKAYTNFKLAVRMEHEDRHHRHASDLTVKGQSH